MGLSDEIKWWSPLIYLRVNNMSHDSDNSILAEYYGSPAFKKKKSSSVSKYSE